MAVEGAAVDLAKALVLEPTPIGDWLVITPTAITAIGGSVLLILRRSIAIQVSAAICILGTLVISNLLLLGRVLANGPIAMTMGQWLPPFGISFTADVLGATLALAGSVVALAVAIYAAADVPETLHRYGFYPFLVIMMMGVSGAFLTGDIFNLYVWFEVLLISSFGLIVLGNRTAQLDGALRYALLNLIATTLFLIAVGYLYGVLGTLNMADLAVRIRALDGTAPLGTVAALFILAFGMKAAAFPLQFWLPASYHVPALSTSAIFAGLLTKVGVYALIRTLVMLMPAELAFYETALTWIAIATMMVGALGALAETDLRRIAGYFVIAGIGTILAGAAIGTQVGVAGAIVYTIHSMLAVTAIYLLVGLIERVGGSSDMRTLGGLYASHPVLATLMLLLVFAQAGLPPLSGFWPKVMITRAALAEGQWILAFVVLASGLLLSIAGSRAFAHVFWRGGPQGGADGQAIVGPAAASLSGVLLAPITAFALFLAVIGLWPAPLLDLAAQAAGGLLNPALYADAVFGAGP